MPRSPPSAPHLQYNYSRFVTHVALGHMDLEHSLRLGRARAHHPAKCSLGLVAARSRCLRKTNLVERFFCRVKDMHRLTTRCEKLKRNFLSMVYSFAIRCWIH
ncbi:transposase [Roseobacter sp. TSBP12]|uniref:transposase n=1 Tax=Roseobacter sp. TSBP12 TaxID=1236613 RepID=UPI0009DB1E9E|nr:hypothetical protein C8029_14825 [Roseobacter sp. TSBP12]